MVSVIIPNYNHAKYLKQRIDSVLNQTFQNFEVIILDDCSADNSKEIIETYRNHPKISAIIYNETNSGNTFKQWNKGIRLAKGNIIWIAESDDVTDKNFLSTLTPQFELDKNLGLAYCQSYMYNDADEVTGSWIVYTNDLDKELFLREFSMKGNDYIEKFLIFKNTIPNASAVLFRKDVYQSFGGADENLRNNSDWLTWLKILMSGSICYNPQCLNYFRRHEQSVIAKAIRNTDISDFEKQGGAMRIKFGSFLLSASTTAQQKRIYNLNQKLVPEKTSLLQNIKTYFSKIKKAATF